MFRLAVTTLLMLHGPDGREIDVSPDEITSLHCRLPGVKNQFFAEGVNSVINLTDGKYVSVRETCVEVRNQLNRAQQEKQR